MITGKIYRSPEEWTALLTTPEVLAWERKVEKVRHEAAQTFQSSEGTSLPPRIATSYE